ncbi:hypothetical protein [Azospirillum largimobile]
MTEVQSTCAGAMFRKPFKAELAVRSIRPGPPSATTARCPE